MTGNGTIPPRANVAGIPTKLDATLLMGRRELASSGVKKELLPLSLQVVQRHSEGGQAFRAEPGQAINFQQGTWQGRLAPFLDSGLFAVVDRIGDGANLEDHWFKESYVIER